MFWRRRSDLRFLFHLPKTAGGTIFHSIRGTDPNLWPTPDGRTHFEVDKMPRRSKRSIWQGNHVAYGLHKIYRAVPSYVTVFREPTERLLSEFFYSSAQNNPLLFRPQEERLPAFVRFVEEAPHLNYYCYMFSDYCFEKEGRWNGKPEHALALLDARISRFGFLSSRVDYAACDPNVDFAKSSKAISGYYHIGIYERLPDLALWFERLGVAFRMNERHHVTDFKPLISDLPMSIQTALQRKTEADRELYEYAISLNSAQMRS